MKITLSPAILGVGCALVASTALTKSVRADSVMTINPDGSVAQVDSAQDGSQQALGGNVGEYSQAAGADAYIDYGSNNGYYSGNDRVYTGARSDRRHSGQVNSEWPNADSSGWGAQARGVQGTSSGVLPNSYSTARSSGRSGLQSRSRSTARNATPLHRGGGDGRNERDIIIDGDDNTVIIWPGNGYGGYYPPYWGSYPIHVYPGYSGPGYGYPGYGYPGYGYPRYVNRNYGLVPYVSGPSFGVSPLFGFPLIGHYGPGTFGHSYNGTINGGFGGFSAGKGGINVTLGGGRQRVTSRSETTIMPNTSVSTTFGFPGGNSSLSPFVRPNVGAQRGGLGMGRLR